MQNTKKQQAQFKHNMVQTGETINRTLKLSLHCAQWFASVQQSLEEGGE